MSNEQQQHHQTLNHIHIHIHIITTQVQQHYSYRLYHTSVSQSTFQHQLRNQNLKRYCCNRRTSRTAITKHLHHIIIIIIVTPPTPTTCITAQRSFHSSQPNTAHSLTFHVHNVVSLLINSHRGL